MNAFRWNNRTMDLKRTPIREIIFTISFNETVDITTIGKFKNLPHISSQFPEAFQGYHADIKEIDGKKPRTSVSHDGYILKTNTIENRILHVRGGSFAFHKIKDYEKFDLLSKEFERYWLDFEKCVGHPLSVTMISVRYLNFIEKNSNESRQDLVNVYPSFPPLLSDKINGFIHLKFKYPGNEFVNANIVTADTKDDIGEGIIFDIFLDRKINNEQDGEKIFRYLYDLREIKNNLFFNCVTSHMIKKYNQ